MAVRLETLGPAAVVLEATRGLEVPLVSALAGSALPVVVVNPRQVRDFAKATGRLAKTDALDAQVLAHFAEAVRPPVRQLRDADAQELNAMTTRRNQVMTMLVAGTNRLSRAILSVRPSIQAQITWLEQELKDPEDDLRQTLRRNPVWREKDDLLRSVPGVGEQMSLVPLAYLPELGTRNHAGDPAVWGVRAGFRMALYMGALVASRRNPAIREFYQRMLASGESKKLALTACMRKLLVILNGMVKSGQHWNPHIAMS